MTNKNDKLTPQKKRAPRAEPRVQEKYRLRLNVMRNRGQGRWESTAEEFSLFKGTWWEKSRTGQWSDTGKTIEQMGDLLVENSPEPVPDLCTYGGNLYNVGEKICINGWWQTCSTGGEWDKSDVPCAGGHRGAPEGGPE